MSGDKVPDREVPLKAQNIKTAKLLLLIESLGKLGIM
jgi:hypothetical protein